MSVDIQGPPREAGSHQQQAQSDMPSLKSFSEHSRAKFGIDASSYDEEALSDLVKIDELHEVTDAKVPETIIEAPALPQRSLLRRSRVLDSLKISTIEAETTSLTTPHEMYLSSEEDASSSADDFSDYDYDSSGEESLSRPDSRRSHEDTARVVSVVFSGKPSIIDLPSPRRLTPSVSSEPSTESLSNASAEDLHQTTRKLPQRQSSLPPTANTTDETVTHKPSFLNIDPYAGSSLQKEDTQSPLTPTAVFHRVSRSLSIARKRSKPALKNNHLGTIGSTSTLNLSIASDESNTSPQPAQSPAPRRNEAAMKNHTSPAKSQREPYSPSSPSPIKKGLLTGLNLARRRSIRV